jgi:hypothetical protein
VTIDAYLSELERTLSWTARRRALPEIREHLRDCAARHLAEGASATEAEERATAAFGPADEVARRVGGQFAVQETRVASLVTLVAVALFVFPFYVVPENSLPPAPWAEKPFELLVLQRLTLALWLVAGAAAIVSAALAWSRWQRAAWMATITCAAAITAATAVSGVLSWRWVEHSPSTPNLALANALALPIVAACALAAVWARARRRDLAAA